MPSSRDRQQPDARYHADATLRAMTGAPHPEAVPSSL